MEHDDRLVGRILSRREALELLVGGAGLTAAAWGARERLDAFAQTPGSTPLPACVVRPELEEGPYFVDQQLHRSDIRADPTTGEVSAGAPLALSFVVSQIAQGQCRPLAGASIDVWHCDARGIYSGGSGPRQPTQPADSKFLRGVQTTDTQGRAVFNTIYPGWYRGRAVHVHFKIRTSAAPGGTYEFTSQLFFDDTFTDAVYARPPYTTRGTRDTLNRTDGIFRSGGSRMMLNPIRRGEGFVADAFSIGLDLSDAAVGRQDGMGGRGPGQGRGPGRGRG